MLGSTFTTKVGDLTYSSLKKHRIMQVRVTKDTDTPTNNSEVE